MACYENWLDYIEVDIVADRIQRTGIPSNHIDHDAWNDEITYVYKDFGAAHFGDFEHFVDTYIASASATYTYGSPWTLANAIGDMQALIGGTFIGVWVRQKTLGLFEIQLRERHAGNWYECNKTVAVTTWLYLRVKKVGTAFTVRIWTNSADRDANNIGAGSYVGQCSLTLQADHTFRYLYPANTYNSGFNKHIIYDVEKHQLFETTAPTVVTNPATNCAADGLSVQLNGNVTATGGENVTRGFRWGNTMGGPYPNTWSDAGIHGIGVYSHIITISCDTDYYYTAVATNCAGTSYGAEQTFNCPCPVTPPKPEPKVEVKGGEKPLWQYIYKWRHIPSEKIYGSVIRKFMETRKLRSKVCNWFSETLGVLCERFADKFQETKSIIGILFIKFTETCPTMGYIIKKFEETKLVSALVFIWFVDKERVYGETKSIEEDVLEELERIVESE